MSSIAVALYLWLLCAGMVGGEAWLIALSLAVLLVSILLLRGKGTTAVFLLAGASSAIALTSFFFPPRIGLSFDPFSSVRKLVTNALTGVDADSASIVLGLAIGDDSQVSHDLENAMQVTSLSHLMAVSGANCAIVLGAIYFALYKFGIRTRVTVSLISLASYVLLVGLQPSVLRAALMSSAVLVALTLGRKVNPLSALALSILILLSISPALSLSYSFTLSVFATSGILTIAPKIYLRLKTRLPSWIAIGLAVSAAAQLFCLPILLNLQGGVPTYSLLANLLCEPLVAPVTVLGLLATIFVWLPPVAAFLFWLASVVAWPITYIAKSISAWPFATMPWRLDGLGISLAVVAVVAVVIALNARQILTKNISWLVLASLFAGSAGVIWSQAVRLSTWPMSDWQVASCDVGQGDATVVRDQNAVAVIDVGRDEKKIDSCLSKLGILHIDLLVLTHFDADHVNGLSGALRNRTVSKAMLTSFEDDRPGADFSRFLLDARKIQTFKSEQGLVGSLSRISWKVLSPTKTAAEAEDSNDGSITMLWRFKDFQLITLADLGEKGQQRLASSIGTWWSEPSLPLVMKVSHHGSADQYAEFIEWLHPKLALVSVGAHNGYGHPTARTLSTLNRAGATTLRTDQLGSIAMSNQDGQFEVSYSGSS